MPSHQQPNVIGLSIILTLRWQVQADDFQRLCLSHLHGIGKKKQKLQIGYGLRFTSFVGANKYYTTAPAEYTSTVQDVGTIFSETIEENIGTIATSTALSFSLNVALYIQYTLTPKIDVGCNIDVIGFSFGPSKSFNVISSVYDAGQEPVQRASPTTFNLLLTSDNDIGSLNSEFYVRYKFNSKISLRAGYAFLSASTKPIIHCLLTRAGL